MNTNEKVRSCQKWERNQFNKGKLLLHQEGFIEPIFDVEQITGLWDGRHIF